MSSHFFIVFEDDSVKSMLPDEVGKLCFDLKSWWNLFSLSQGYIQDAELTIRLPQAPGVRLVSKAKAYLTNPQKVRYS